MIASASFIFASSAVLSPAFTSFATALSSDAFAFTTLSFSLPSAAVFAFATADAMSASFQLAAVYEFSSNADALSMALLSPANSSEEAIFTSAFMAFISFVTNSFEISSVTSSSAVASISS